MSGIPEMYVILVAHVLNTAMETANLAGETQVVDLDLAEFVSQLQLLVLSYRRTFQHSDEAPEVDAAFVGELVAQSDFHRFVSVANDKVSVEYTPQKFQSLLTGILVDSSIKYSKMLASEVDELTERRAALQPQIVVLEAPLVPAKQPEMVGAKEAEQELEIKEKEKIETEQAFEEESKEDEPTSTESNEVQESTSDKEDTDPTDTAKDSDSAAQGAADAEDEAEEDVDMEDQTTNAAEQTKDQQESEEKLDLASSDELIVDDPEETETPAQDEPTETLETQEGIKEEETASPDVEVESANQHLKPEVVVRTSTPAKEELISEERSSKRSMSPVPTSQKRKRFQNIAVNLVKTIEEHRFSSPFLVPVVADQYEEVVYDPKDLKSILKAIKQKDEPAAYETVKELERDIMLMFANCVMYNKSSAHLVGMAKQMRDDVRNTFKMFEDAELEIA